MLIQIIVTNTTEMHIKKIHKDPVLQIWVQPNIKKLFYSLTFLFSEHNISRCVHPLQQYMDSEAAGMYRHWSW